MKIKKMKIKKMKYYWLSWVQKSDDHRPLTYPPNAQILGWWCSGYDGEGNATICAQVAAKSKKDAHKAVLKDWPEKIEVEWRFINQKSEKKVTSDRFPLEDWMEERMK